MVLEELGIEVNRLDEDAEVFETGKIDVAGVGMINLLVENSKINHWPSNHRRVTVTLHGETEEERATASRLVRSALGLYCDDSGLVLFGDPSTNLGESPHYEVAEECLWKLLGAVDLESVDIERIGTQIWQACSTPIDRSGVSLGAITPEQLVLMTAFVKSRLIEETQIFSKYVGISFQQEGGGRNRLLRFERNDADGRKHEVVDLKLEFRRSRIISRRPRLPKIWTREFKGTIALSDSAYSFTEWNELKPLV